MTTAQDGGKVVILTHRAPLPSQEIAKTGHGPHSSKIVVLFYVLFVSFYVLFVCKCILLPPGDNPIAVNKYIISKHTSFSTNKNCSFIAVKGY